MAEILIFSYSLERLLLRNGMVNKTVQLPFACTLMAEILWVPAGKLECI